MPGSKTPTFDETRSALVVSSFMEFSQDDWKKLEDLRSSYLSESPSSRKENYWNISLLELYHKTFAERIRWKWNAVLKELKDLSFEIGTDSALLDLGCGTGIASLAFLDHFPSIKSITLEDKSPLAVSYAQKQIQTKNPNIVFSNTKKDILLISHVRNELNDKELSELLEKIKPYNTVLWVEPGTKFLSSELIKIRELLRSEFNIIAPCPHSEKCGLFRNTSSPHWCHFYAPVPAEISQNRFWNEFSKRLHIDIRSLPVSYLVLSKTFKPTQGNSRVLAGSRFYKGYAQAVVCSESKVDDTKFLERNNKAFIKEMKKNLFRLLVKNE